MPSRKSNTEKGILDNLRRGTIEIVLLSMLETEDQYGYQLSQKLKELSSGQYDLNDATMYPTLYRLVQRGYLETDRVNVIGRRFRVYYHLSESGREYLNMQKDQYFSFRDTMDELLKKIDAQKK